MRILLIIAALCVASLVVYSAWFLPMPPDLTVIVRCSGDLSGELSLNHDLEKTTELNESSYADEQFKGEQFSVALACEHSEIKFKRYKPKQNMLITWETGEGEMLELVSYYGKDIQSDQDGYYLLLNMTDAPAITNGNI